MRNTYMQPHVVMYLSNHCLQSQKTHASIYIILLDQCFDSSWCWSSGGHASCCGLAWCKPKTVGCLSTSTYAHTRLYLDLFGTDHVWRTSYNSANNIVLGICLVAMKRHWLKPNTPPIQTWPTLCINLLLSAFSAWEQFFPLTADDWPCARASGTFLISIPQQCHKTSIEPHMWDTPLWWMLFNIVQQLLQASGMTFVTKWQCKSSYSSCSRLPLQYRLSTCMMS